MAVNTISDFIIFLWPIIPLWQIQISLRQRLNLCVVFGFGMITCLGAIVKIAFAKRYLSSWDSTCKMESSFYCPDIRLIHPPDMAGPMVITFAIEYNVGIMCACLPCLRPLLVMMFPKHFASSSAAKAQYQVPPTIGSGGEKRCNAPFRSHPSDAIKLDGDDNYSYNDTFELDDTKDSSLKSPGYSWIESGRRGADGTSPENGIHVQRNVSVQGHSRSPAIRVTADTSSEEWIMEDDHALP